MSKEADRNWQELANAVIVQAAKDYRLAQYRNMKRPEQENTLREIRSLETFFRSKWFAVLSTLDGKRLLRDLREQMGLEG